MYRVYYFEFWVSVFCCLCISHSVCVSSKIFIKPSTVFYCYPIVTGFCLWRFYTQFFLQTMTCLKPSSAFRSWYGPVLLRQTSSWIHNGKPVSCGTLGRPWSIRTFGTIVGGLASVRRDSLSTAIPGSPSPFGWIPPVAAWWSSVRRDSRSPCRKFILISSYSTSRSMLATMLNTIQIDVIFTIGEKILLKSTPFFF